jgi:hypothetical protein
MLSLARKAEGSLTVDLLRVRGTPEIPTSARTASRLIISAPAHPSPQVGFLAAGRASNRGQSLCLRHVPIGAAIDTGTRKLSFLNLVTLQRRPSSTLSCASPVDPSDYLRCRSNNDSFELICCFLPSFPFHHFCFLSSPSSTPARTLPLPLLPLTSYYSTSILLI